MASALWQRRNVVSVVPKGTKHGFRALDFEERIAVKQYYHSAHAAPELTSRPSVVPVPRRFSHNFFAA